MSAPTYANEICSMDLANMAKQFFTIKRTGSFCERELLNSKGKLK